MECRVVLCILALLGAFGHVDGARWFDHIIEGAVNKTIRKVAGQLGNLTKNGSTVIDTKEQEFGRFILDLIDINVSGFENTIGEIIDLTPWPVRVTNLTFYVPRLTLHCPDYQLNGFLMFPLTNVNVTLTGSDGPVEIELNDVRASVYLLPKINESSLWIQESRIEISTSAMTVYLDKLMGGGAVGHTFNTVLNDSATIAFDYFKYDVISHYTPNINEFIASAICFVLPEFCKLGEYYYDFIEKWFDYYNTTSATT